MTSCDMCRGYSCSRRSGFRCILCFIINAPPPRLSPTTATARGASRARLVPNATLFVYFIILYLFRNCLGFHYSKPKGRTRKPGTEQLAHVRSSEVK